MQMSVQASSSFMVEAVNWLESQSQHVFKARASSELALTRIVRLRRPMLKWDRQQSLLKHAKDAQYAADTNHTKKLFGIVSSFSGKAPSPLKMITDENGQTIEDSKDAVLRWRRHFTSLFRAG